MEVTPSHTQDAKTLFFFLWIFVSSSLSLSHSSSPLPHPLRSVPTTSSLLFSDPSTNLGFLKFLIHRSRPSYSFHNDYNVVVTVDNFSFPSGQSSRVCFIISIFSLSHASIIDAVTDPSHLQLAMLVHHWIGGDDVMAVNLLVTAVWSWALTIVISRVVLGRHYVLDVCFGACFDVLEAPFTLRFLKFHVLI